jgi:hypothetical protein
MHSLNGVQVRQVWRLSEVGTPDFGSMTHLVKQLRQKADADIPDNVLKFICLLHDPIAR